MKVRSATNAVVESRLLINRNNQALNCQDVTWPVGIRCPAFRRLARRVKASFFTRSDSQAENKLVSSQRRFFSKIIPPLIYHVRYLYLYAKSRILRA